MGALISFVGVRVEGGKQERGSMAEESKALSRMQACVGATKLALFVYPRLWYRRGLLDPVILYCYRNDSSSRILVL